jgi:hypothetical protein
MVRQRLHIIEMIREGRMTEEDKTRLRDPVVEEEARR